MLVGKTRAGNLPDLAQEVLVEDRAVLATSQNYRQHLQVLSSPSNLVLYALEAGNFRSDLFCDSGRRGPEPSLIITVLPLS